jgi:hypothetical protein
VDRDSLRRLRVQPGYLRFVSAATLARVSDEMFSVGVVLLVLDRTGSAEALLLAACAQVAAAAVGMTLARLPARALPQASPGR